MIIKHKSLVVQIDESLSCCPHINTISKKISAGLAIFKRVSPILPFDTRVNNCTMHQLVMPSFNCCSAVWGNNKELADKLQKMQKRAASLILHTIPRKTI